MIIIGSSGYIGRPLLSKANQGSSALGSSTMGINGTIKFNLESPDDFPYEKLNTNETIVLTAAISAPDICSRDFKRAWDTNVEKTTYFIKKVFQKIKKNMSRTHTTKNRGKSGIFV
jgi:nucleoside-diphosphate-sugar epimerase